jgi:general secretion pathway protein A
VAYIFNPKLSVVRTAADRLRRIRHPVAPGEASIKSHVDALNRFLLDAHAQGQQALLVIDEAQSLSAEVLEQLRLLTNLETAERKLLQIILIGQPELRDMLAQPGLEQLAQRVIARYHLGPLSREESAQYVAHRLAVAGPDGRTGGAALFDPAALSALHRLAAGVPRRINLLADRALLGAYAQGRRRVDRRTVVRAAAEVFADTRRTRASAGPAWPAAAWWAVALLGLCLVMLAHMGLSAAFAGRSRRMAGPGEAPGAASVPARAASQAGGSGLGGARGLSLPLAWQHAGLGGFSLCGPCGARGCGFGPASPASPPSALAEPADVLASAHADEGTAWRELALHWQVAVGHGEPCAVVVQAQLACLRQPKGGVPALRRSNRPAVLTLVGPTGHLFYAVLVALDDERATLQAGSRHWVLSLPALATIWRGDSATLWRTPPGWREGGDAVSQDRTTRLGGAAPAAAWSRNQSDAARSCGGLSGDAGFAVRWPCGSSDTDATQPACRRGRATPAHGGPTLRTHVLHPRCLAARRIRTGPWPGARPARSAGAAGYRRSAQGLACQGAGCGLGPELAAGRAGAVVDTPAAPPVPAAVVVAPAAVAPTVPPATTPVTSPAAPAPTTATPVLPQVVSAPTPVLPASVPVAPAAAAPLQQASISRLAELPPDQRREWPNPVLGGSVWSESAANRFVIVNGQLLHEGEAVAPGLIVERIGPKAVVLRWRDRRVEVPL